MLNLNGFRAVIGVLKWVAGLVARHPYADINDVINSCKNYDIILTQRALTMLRIASIKVQHYYSVDKLIIN
jgi:hypothetical protein